MAVEPKVKVPWSFQANMAPDARGARALEYIAHYLERIDDHLAQIATGTTPDQAKALKAAIDGVAGAINRNAR